MEMLTVWRWKFMHNIQIFPGIVKNRQRDQNPTTCAYLAVHDYMWIVHRTVTSTMCWLHEHVLITGTHTCTHWLINWRYDHQPSTNSGARHNLSIQPGTHSTWACAHSCMTKHATRVKQTTEMGVLHACMVSRCTCVKQTMGACMLWVASRKEELAHFATRWLIAHCNLEDNMSLSLNGKSPKN